ncbi:transposase, partial [Aeromonas caviae]
MSKQQRYTEEFKLAAVKQVAERNYPVAEVAERLGISSHSLYVWIKRYNQPEAQQQHDFSQQAEIRRLKAELRRVTDERDILKKAMSQLRVASGALAPHANTSWYLPPC